VTLCDVVCARETAFSQRRRSNREREEGSEALLCPALVTRLQSPVELEFEYATATLGKCVLPHFLNSLWCHALIDHGGIIFQFAQQFNQS
jgi:hypothetical protein